jgi:hypothetical protein
MGESADIIWIGEKNRQLGVYRACPCGVCEKSRLGIGYLSFSDANGHGFTIWIEDEKVFRRLRHALRRFKEDRADNQRRHVTRESSSRLHELQ